MYRTPRTRDEPLPRHAQGARSFAPYLPGGKWYKTTPKGKVKTDTITAIGTGTPWTTGSVTVYATQGAFTTTLRRAGYDNRSALGLGALLAVRHCAGRT